MNQERMPSDDQAGRIMSQALFSQAREYTYCLISEGESTGISTAVAVELAGHYFLATAGHVIPKDGTGIKAILRDRTALDFSDFAARHWDRVHDVGSLEITPAGARHFRFLQLDAIEPEIVVNQELLPAFLVGYPAQFATPAGALDLTADVTCQFLDCHRFCYNTILLPRSERPDELPDESALPRQLTDDDMLLDYDQERFVRIFTAQTAGTDNPTIPCDAIVPKGMSGCGIWLGQVNQSLAGIVSPGMRLIGIQSGWYPDRNLLVGVRLGRWLDLVRREYSDVATVET